MRNGHLIPEARYISSKTTCCGWLYANIYIAASLRCSAKNIVRYKIISCFLEKEIHSLINNINLAMCFRTGKNLIKLIHIVYTISNITWHYNWYLLSLSITHVQVLFPKYTTEFFPSTLVYTFIANSSLTGQVVYVQNPTPINFNQDKSQENIVL